MAVRISGSVRKDAFTVEPIVGTQLVDPATGSVQPVGQSGYTLLMSEEFGGAMTTTDAGLGLVKFRAGGPEWATWYPNWSNFTVQNPGGNHTNTNYESYYATSKVSLDGAGALKLACDKETTVAGLDYTAGMIQSLGFCNPLYGYFEARIKLTTASVTGHWPAFWASCSQVNTWPPEIDFYEYFGNGTTYENNTFTPGGSNFGGNATATQTGYHVYGCKWDATHATFYLDGVQTNQSTTAQTPQAAMYVLLNNGARTPANPTFNSNDMFVDYVRVWQ